MNETELRGWNKALDEVEWRLSKYLGPSHRAIVSVKAMRDERIPPDEFVRERTKQTDRSQPEGETQA